MGLSASGLLPLIATAVMLWLLAALSVAGRSLNRLQMRAWAGDDRDEDPLEGDNGVLDVETSFVALGIARQLALVFLVVQIVLLVGRLAWEPQLPVAVGLALLAYVMVDRMLPYWGVALMGSSRVLALGNPLYRLVRLLFGPVAEYLIRTAGRGRTRGLSEELEAERHDLGAFLDLAEEEGMMSESEEALLRGFADFEDTVVREVMTPRVDIISVDADGTLGDLRGLIAEHRLSRIPVIDEDLDHVVGVVHIKDLVGALGGEASRAPLAEIIRPAWFVPETKRVSELLPEFQQRQMQMAIVVDEYGGTAGLVTLEDVLEEIVGEIQDESEEPESLIESDGAGILASGKAEIEDIEQALSMRVPEGEFHTVGGMVFTQLGHVPESGESLEFGELRIEVLEADERRIHRVRIVPR